MVFRLFSWFLLLASPKKKAAQKSSLRIIKMVCLVVQHHRHDEHGDCFTLFESVPRG